MNIRIMTEAYDTWIKPEDLPTLDAEDIQWFEEEIGVSRADLSWICAKAKEIVQGLEPNDEILDLCYDPEQGAWYIHFERSMHTGGRWTATVYRKDKIPCG